jgi:hypothetical protein
VEVAAVWMPKSEFRHVTHAPFACRDCHAAAAGYDPEDAQAGERPAWSLPGAGPYALFTPAELRERALQPSESAEDVLLPGIATCRSCHGGASAAPPLVASGCVLCHPFHRAEHGPLRERTAAARSAHFALPSRGGTGVDFAAGNGGRTERTIAEWLRSADPPWRALSR